MKKIAQCIFFSTVCAVLPNYASPVKRFSKSMVRFMPLCTPTKFNCRGPLDVPPQRVFNGHGSRLIVGELVFRKRLRLGDQTNPANATDAMELLKQAYAEGADEVHWFVEEEKE